MTMKNSKRISLKGLLVTMLVIGNIIVLRTAFVTGAWYEVLAFTVLILVLVLVFYWCLKLMKR
jgi:hypothetical protein